MNVLGWARRDAQRPSDMTWHMQGDIALLLAAAPLPRDRLALQVACFDAGCDLLPVAPSLLLSLDDARRLSKEIDINAGLFNFSGKCQITLTMSAQHDQHPQTTTGRAWISLRKARHDQAMQHARTLSTLLAGLGHSVTQPRHQKSGVQCDVLICRERASALKESIKVRLAAVDEQDNSSLLVTGPWPPYAFTNICNNLTAAA